MDIYKGIPTPFWFYKSSADAFHNMNMESSDVVFSSGVKCGTTWVNKILHLLLHDNDVGSVMPVYPDRIPLDDNEINACKNGNEAQQKKMKLAETISGSLTFQQHLEQAHPRLFVTHLRGKDQLPLQLVGNNNKEGKGRLIICLRNVKDVMASLHFFKGEAKDGWLGNEHGIGSFNRFIAEDCPNGFGSYFDWIKDSDDVVQMLQSKRVLVLYYEELKTDLPSELDRINDFLDLPPLTDEKREALVEKVSFGSMRSKAGDKLKGFWRKGEIGDWKNYLSEKEWKKIDELFEKKLGNVKIAQPLRKYH
mmetsp:Transcript_18926/g.26045  ORF Transcript_18926/g.26045 Transcript_18926/m.26045 type:complete len:307 (-) Transcript_18926:376-1296(-)